jgi:hypothetical protein
MERELGKWKLKFAPPQMVFMQPQRLVVPLFQRPYVWNEENQWEPLWNDVVRVTDTQAIEKAQQAVSRIAPKAAAAATETESTSR